MTDSKGNPVHGLTRDDFTVKEDGNERPIRSFEEFGTRTVQPLPKLPPNVYSNVQPPAASGATNILWLDFTNAAPVMSVACCILPPPHGDPTLGPKDLARSVGWQKYAKQYAEQYVKQMPTGTRVAVFGTRYPDRLRVLQEVTSDPVLLSAAIDAMPYDTHGEVAEPSNEEWLAQQERRNHMTLEALAQMASGLAQIKGRKNLIWYNARIWTLVSGMVGRPKDLSDNTRDLQRVYGLLAAAQVTVFPVSITGLEQPDGPVGRLAMEAIAESTGGKAYYNSNDLADLTAKAINSGSDYYTLSYVPPGSEYDGRHHTIKVVANQPGLRLTYRDEYYAEDPRKIAPTPSLTLDATQILFRVRVTQSPASSTPSAQNNPDPKHMHPPYRHLSIAYTIDIHGIDFTQKADSNYRGAFEYGVNVYNSDGDVINSTANTVSPIVPPAVYQSMLRTGANAHRDIDVPATGNYFLRIAVHDITSGRVGAIEIPTASLTPNSTPTP